MLAPQQRLRLQQIDRQIRGPAALADANLEKLLSLTEKQKKAVEEATKTLDEKTDAYLGKLREGYYDYHWIEHPISRLVINGDVALVWGEMNADITAGGVQKQLRNKCLSVWVREDGNWALLAFQPTKYPA